MKWRDVFGKAFMKKGWGGFAMVFVPGTLTADEVRFLWVPLEDLESGIDLSERAFTYPYPFSLLDGPKDSLTREWRPIHFLTKEDKLCRKVRQMEERWGVFQRSKGRVAYCSG